MVFIHNKIPGYGRGSVNKISSIDYTCFICGAHELQGCYCDPDEEAKAKSEFLEKFKNMKKVTMTLKELLAKVE